jgi:hypothetical protein
MVSFHFEVGVVTAPFDEHSGDIRLEIIRQNCLAFAKQIRKSYVPV